MLKENQYQFSNKIILVTGASKGIGKEAAITFAKHGATVILLARDIRALEHVYDRIIELNAPEPAIFPLDLSAAGPEQFMQLQEAITEEFGRLDGILHNASMVGDLTPLEYYNPRNWQEIIQVNLNAPYLLTQFCLPLLKKSASASILFTTSHFPENCKAYWGAYGVAKHGIIGLMQTLAAELSNKPISINAINPGPVRSPLRAKTYPAEDKGALRTPKEIMPAYLHMMLSDKNKTSGEIINAQDFLDMAQSIPVAASNDEALIA